MRIIGIVNFPIAKWVISHYSYVHMIEHEKKLVSMAEAYCASENIKLSTLGRMIVNDGKFFKRLSEDGSCTTKTFNRVLTWFSEHKPKRSN